MERWLLGLAVSGLVTLAAGCGRANAPSSQTAGATASASDLPAVQAASKVAAGRYLVQIGGCNDCHTPGWMQKPGAAPDSEWLTGVPVGFKGPWGTTYAKNLRLFVQQLTEAQWLAVVSKPDFARPPMPVYDVNQMSKADQQAIYAFIRSLGAAGKTMPEDLPPGQEPQTPYIPFAPVAPGGTGQSGSR